MEKTIFKLQGLQTELKEMEHELNTLREQQIFKPKHKKWHKFLNVVKYEGNIDLSKPYHELIREHQAVVDIAKGASSLDQILRGKKTYAEAFKFQKILDNVDEKYRQYRKKPKLVSFGVKFRRLLNAKKNKVDDYFFWWNKSYDKLSMKRLLREVRAQLDTFIEEDGMESSEEYQNMTLEERLEFIKDKLHNRPTDKYQTKYKPLLLASFSDLEDKYSWMEFIDGDLDPVLACSTKFNMPSNVTGSEKTNDYNTNENECVIDYLVYEMTRARDQGKNIAKHYTERTYYKNVFNMKNIKDGVRKSVLENWIRNEVKFVSVHILTHWVRG